MRFNHDLIEKISDDLLEEVKAKLPDACYYRNDRIKIPVILETPMIERLSDIEIVNDSTLDSSILIFEFVKDIFPDVYWKLDSIDIS